jgi:hypothetical protein
MSKQETLRKQELLFIGYDETYGVEVYIGTGLKDSRQADGYTFKAKSPRDKK